MRIPLFGVQRCMARLGKCQVSLYRDEWFPSPPSLLKYRDRALAHAVPSL